MRRTVLVVVAVMAVASAARPAGAANDAPAAGERVKSGDYTLELPLGLQASAVYIPEENPLSAAKIDLGRLLYFDKRLSVDGTVSCATCHDPAHGFAEPRKTSVGVGGKVGARNAPTVINRLFSKEQFWDGRGADLEDQAKGPMTNPIEMAMPSHEVVVKQVAAVPGYPPLFARAFGTPEVTIDRIAQAIAAFERTVIAGNSAFDRYQAGNRTAMNESAVRGLALFNGKANCVTCHAGFNFTDESYHNIGVGMHAKEPDPGRVKITKATSETGAFKTPTLRNVTQTAPYMHDGSEATLVEVVAYYDRGGNPNPYLSKEMHPLQLSPAERADLVAFLEALTSDGPHVTPPREFPK
jgi:cytochrome c peroxidase